MWWKSAVFLLLLQLSWLSAQEIGCNYVNRGANYPYMCQLTINNPEGSDAFTSIPGTHLAGFTDADVLVVDAFQQNTLNVPSVICRQFPNLRDFYLAFNNIQIINESSFAACENMLDVILLYNVISEVPDNTFRNNGRLEFIHLNYNNITQLRDRSFAGSAARYIDLQFNNIGAGSQNGLYRSSWFDSVNSTLQTLNLMNNGLSGLEVNAFNNLRNLQSLDLTSNNLQSVSESSFNGLTSLNELYLIQCGLSNLRTAWFRDMRQLQNLRLEFNEIRDLPNGVFASLDSLINLYLGYNNLTQITTAPFGDNAFNIIVLSLTQNQVLSIEPVLFDRLENVNSIEMSDNVCNQQNIVNIQQNRENTRIRLRRCFDNFGPRFINCQFAPMGGFYSCVLTVRNAEGTDFPRIPGTHLTERFDEDVHTVYANYQNTRSIPPVICRQFIGTVNMMIMSSYVETINEASFAGCLMLENLHFDNNEIHTIPDNTFRNNPTLIGLFLNNNRINHIGFTAFTGSGINFLDLANNAMFELNPVVLEPINSTLTTLDYLNNRLGIMYNDAFANVRNIRTLILSGNAFYQLPGNSFQSLTNLEELGLSNCGITTVNPAWFNGLSNLHTLFMGSNRIVDLPDNVFNTLTSLRELHIYNNQIIQLRNAALGASISSLTLIYGIGNDLNVVDPAIINSGTNLNMLFLQNNLCTSLNFYGVNTNPASVIQRLETCVNNFALPPAISCNYQRTGSVYWCQMSLHNPVGESFTTIGGDHLGSFTDSDVRFVTVDNQNTKVVPSIICGQFSGLNRLDIYTSVFNVVNRDGFTNCTSVREMILMRNQFTTIQGGTFESMRNLRFLGLPSNRLRTLSQGSFQGTIIEELDLSWNELTTWNEFWIYPIVDTLRVINLSHNRLMNINPNAFNSMFNIVELRLTDNPIQTFPHTLFQPMTRLQTLHLAACQITEIVPVWFAGKPALRNIELDQNFIRDIPVNAFNVATLQHVGLADNQLRAVDVLSFGSSLNSLTNIDFRDNNIEAIDEVFFNNATTLFSMELTDNACANFNIIDIPQNRDNIREFLSTCFAGFAAIQSSCDFEEFEALYRCQLTINNPQGKHRYDRIQGEHEGNRNDNYVTYVLAENQHTRTIPEVICRQYRFVEGITFTQSEVEWIVPETFAGCEFLYSLSLMMNRIRVIPEGAFNQNQYLSSLRLDGNEIAFIAPNSFVNTQIYDLNLEYNRLTSISRTLFAPIARHLMFLDLRGNRITSIPRGVFAEMNRLYYLDLTGNYIQALPSDTFHSMQFLGRLFLANCGLRTLLARHFQEKPFLWQLEVDNNQLTYLAPGVFNIPSLQNLGLSGNRIEMLDSESFGASLGSLVRLAATQNRITGIDSLMLSRSIDVLELLGNMCTNYNFLDVQTNREVVMMYLNGCFINFRRRNDMLRCDYEDYGAMYICMLNLNNEEGHHDFPSVAGDHLEGRRNEDVTRVQAIDQFARRIPLAICRQFTNLREMVIIQSQVVEVNYQTFLHCANIEYVNLNHNQIITLPPELFRNSPRLRTFTSYNNRIREVWPSTWINTQVEYIDLNFNSLGVFPTEAFETVNGTLQHLYVEFNNLTTLPSQALANVRNLVSIDFNGNNFDTIPSNAFTGQDNLNILSLSECGISRLDPAWFTPLTNLTVLYLQFNHITWLPFNVFSPLTRLFNLMLTGNQISELRVGSFNESLRNLFYLYADYNQINSIESSVLDELRSISWLFLSENICANSNFFDVSNNLANVRNELGGCINNFRNDIIRCDYFGGGEWDDYFCLLELHNPDGIEFQTIEGEHQSGFTNNDVIFANAYYQNSRTVPSVICRQFPNLQSMMIVASGVEVIFSDSFEHCTNLEQLFINQNRLQVVWPMSFINSPRLRILDLAYNEISFMHQSTFRGTAIEHLELAFNRLPTYNPVWTADISATITFLDLSFNQMTTLPNGAFSNLTGLTNLIISSNPLTSIPANAFDRLNQLTTLSMSRTNIRELNPEWFASLSALENLYMQNNEIQILPPTIFAAALNLRDLFLYGNQIRELNSNSFGGGIVNLHTIYLGDNFLNFFDQQFLINAENLEYLLLSGNLCIDQDFLNVQRQYWIIYEEIRQCTDNFHMDPWIACNYVENVNSYTCQISIHNPRGLNFDQIDGTHVGSNEANNVTDLIGFYQNTATIPPVLCETFRNLRSIYFWYSNLEELSEDSLRNCENLVELNLQFNWIRSVPDFTFRNNQNLRFLDLNANRLTSLSSDAFTGSSLEYLDLAMNQLQSFDPTSLLSINETLLTLDLLGNSIVSLPPDGFSNIRNIRRLILNNNPLWNIPGDAFRFMTNLVDLFMGSLGLLELNPAWFESLPALESLHIQQNNIREIPNGIFASNLRLRVLEFYLNNVRALNVAAFGQPQSLVSVLAQNNRIRAFDPAIIDRARNLNWLMLSGNICNRDDFFNVQNNLEFVRQRLNFCFANSGPEILQCRFSLYDQDYTCSLQIFNPLGRENFELIEGEHLTGRSNNDVTHLYSGYGNTLNVPEIICQQFPNLVEISLLADQIEYIDHLSFNQCGRIERIWLYANLIEVIPDFVFINNPHLDTLIIENNRINQIGQNAFLGTALSFLDLAGNPLGEFNPFITAPLAETLRILNLRATGLTSIQPDAFVQTPLISDLTLSSNQFDVLPATIFAPLTQLESLIMSAANLRNLNANWFATLSTLRSLYLPSNSIFELPQQVFNGLTSLTNLYIYSNNLRDLDIDAFGNAVTTIETIYASYNEIAGIDPTFLDTATNLNTLMLSQNNCTQENFFDIQVNRDEVRDALGTCFENYVGETINCEYFVTEGGDYACLMSINNPIGRDRFVSVPGQHLTGRTNEDVRVMDIIFQNTRNIPSIICQQFPNVEYFIAWGNNIDVITPTSFAGCRALEYLNLFDNHIVHIQPFTFINNTNLAELELGANRIEVLHPLALEGTALEYIDLAMNRITEFDATWFEAVNGTLKSLDLLANGISSLPQDAFRTIRNLETLVLANNPLRDVPPNAFIALDLLQNLQMSNTQLGHIHSDWFRSMRALQILAINNNGIETFPSNVFAPLSSIDSIFFHDNFIWELTSQQFGSAPLETLRVLDGQNNLINIIDSSLITSATSLRYLLLEGNICINQNFSNVVDYLWTILEYLLQCSENHMREATLSCEYSNLTPSTYMCNIESHNPTGFDGFGVIPGNHTVGNNDSTVSLAYSRGQNMRIFPSAVCRQFPNVLEIMIFQSNVERVSQAAFQNCRRVEYIYLDTGFIRTVPDNTFVNSPNLQYVSFSSNRLTRISPNAFRGTAIDFLDLSHNLIEVFDPAPFETINATLRTLDMLNNRLSGFPFAAFENIAGITELVLNNNPLTNLPFEFLYPLVDLQLLSMANCQLSELHHAWFFTNVNLRQLYVQNNNLPEFQDGVFHNMTSLALLYFYNNQITDLRAISFGMSIPSLTVLNGPSNAINAIDPDLIEDATNLQYLMLASNLCVDNSFFDVRNNMDEVREGLRSCFENFQNQIEVDDWF